MTNTRVYMGDYNREYYARNRQRSLDKVRNRLNESRHEEITYVAYSPALRLYKIGHTANLKARMVVLRGGCPDLEIVTTYPHDRELEHHLHWTFGHVRVPKTEWFRIPHLISIEKAVWQFENAGA